MPVIADFGDGTFRMFKDGRPGSDDTTLAPNDMRRNVVTVDARQLSESDWQQLAQRDAEIRSAEQVWRGQQGQQLPNSPLLAQAPLVNAYQVSQAEGMQGVGVPQQRLQGPLVNATGDGRGALPSGPVQGSMGGPLVNATGDGRGSLPSQPQQVQGARGGLVRLPQAQQSVANGYVPGGHPTDQGSRGARGGLLPTTNGQPDMNAPLFPNGQSAAQFAWNKLTGGPQSLPSYADQVSQAPTDPNWSYYDIPPQPVGRPTTGDLLQQRYSNYVPGGHPTQGGQYQPPIYQQQGGWTDNLTGTQPEQSFFARPGDSPAPQVGGNWTNNLTGQGLFDPTSGQKYPPQPVAAPVAQMPTRDQRGQTQQGGFGFQQPITTQSAGNTAVDGRTVVPQNMQGMTVQGQNGAQLQVLKQGAGGVLLEIQVNGQKYNWDSTSKQWRATP